MEVDLCSIIEVDVLNRSRCSNRTVLIDYNRLDCLLD